MSCKEKKEVKKINKKVKLFSCVEAIKALREQARADLVMGFYGRYDRTAGKKVKA